RMAIVDETGTAIGEEYTLALAVRFILSRKPGPVVVNASTSRVIDEIASEYGVKVTRTQVGEIHVSGKMKEIGAVIGGEGNGGVILPDSHLGRDGVLAIALSLQQLLEYGGPVSRLWKAQPQYAMSKEKIGIGTADPDRILKEVEENHRNLSMDKMDGLKIAGPDSWVQIRKSNTEPIIRVMAEAGTKEAADALCITYLEEIKQLLDTRDV
ncbi:MAG TPA: phosphoglucosamine mutase, partial [bacterium]|nr:phosphoglucosamine mutase [bacterium]